MKSFFRNAGQKFQRFLGGARQHAENGVRFLNGTLIPGAKKAHGIINRVSDTLQQDSNVSEKNRERLKTIQKLSDVGITKLNDTANTINRVKAAI